MKPRVIIESPYAAQTRRDLRRNKRYLRACMADALRRGEAPYASHGLYTQPGVLDDRIPEERRMGIEAGFAWRAAADRTCVYTDLGTSGGMREGIAHALRLGHPVETRTLGDAWTRSEALRGEDEEQDEDEDEARAEKGRDARATVPPSPTAGSGEDASPFPIDDDVSPVS